MLRAGFKKGQAFLQKFVFIVYTSFTFGLAKTKKKYFWIFPFFAPLRIFYANLHFCAFFSLFLFFKAVLKRVKKYIAGKKSSKYWPMHICCSSHNTGMPIAKHKFHVKNQNLLGGTRFAPTIYKSRFFSRKLKTRTGVII